MSFPWHFYPLHKPGFLTFTLVYFWGGQVNKGIDLIAKRVNQTTYVQVKHYQPRSKIGVTVLRQIVGASTRESNVKAMVITASSFTKPAIQESEAYGETLTLWSMVDVCNKIQRMSLPRYEGIIFKTDYSGNLVLKHALEAAMKAEELFIRQS